MKLFCVRHGDAKQFPDKTGERALSPKGIKEIGKVATYLARRGVHVAHMLHSGKKRAQESAAILAESIAKGQPLEVCELLSPEHYNLEAFRGKIQKWHDDTMGKGFSLGPSKIKKSPLTELFINPPFFVGRGVLFR